MIPSRRQITYHRNNCPSRRLLAVLTLKSGDLSFCVAIRHSQRLLIRQIISATFVLTLKSGDLSFCVAIRHSQRLLIRQIISATFVLTLESGNLSLQVTIRRSQLLLIRQAIDFYRAQRRVRYPSNSYLPLG